MRKCEPKGALLLTVLTNTTSFSAHYSTGPTANAAPEQYLRANCGHVAGRSRSLALRGAAGRPGQGQARAAAHLGLNAPGRTRKF
jgi:hypothetical protein